MSSWKKTIRHEVVYPHAASDIWVAITDANALAEWFEPNDHVAEVGHRFRFVVDGASKACEVIEATPPARLVWTWTDEPVSEMDKSGSPMRVGWTIEPMEAGCRLRLEHCGAENMGVVRRTLMRFGWKYMMKTSLPKILANVKEGEFTPGAIPLEKRFYKCQTVPEKYIR